MNINTGEAGEKIDCPVCVVLRYFQYWCPAGSGGEEREDGMRLSFYKTKFRYYFVFVYLSFLKGLLTPSATLPRSSYTIGEMGGEKQWE